MKNLKSQLKRAIAEHTRSGHSKRTDRMNGIDTHMYIYANSAYRDQKAFANSFGGWMMTTYPEIKQVKDITPEHMSEYLDSNAGKWTAGTYNKNVSFAGKLAVMVADTYRCKTDWTEGINKAEGGKEKEYRTACATADELSAIRLDAKTATGEGIKAAVFASFFGLRSGSIPYIQVNDLHLDHIHIRQDKGGRPRDIAITSREQQAAVRAAQAYAARNGRTGSDTIFCCTASAITKAVSRSCKKHGFQALQDAKTGQHAMRKSYARSRYEQEFTRIHGKSPYSDASGNVRHALDPRDPEEKVEYDRKAWNLVDSELGHGRDRLDLFQTYIVQTQG